MPPSAAAAPESPPLPDAEGPPDARPAQDDIEGPTNARPTLTDAQIGRIGADSAAPPPLTPQASPAAASRLHYRRFLYP